MSRSTSILTILSVLSIVWTLETSAAPPGENCSPHILSFSSNELLRIRPGAGVVWGGNAAPWDETQKNHLTYTSSFLKQARLARAEGQLVFAYLEGPCGDTDGNDDGERAACSQKHRGFIAKVKSDPSSPYRSLLQGLDGKGVSERDPRTRWYPYTFAQLMESGKHQIDYCEVDNLDNNVQIPLLRFLEKYRSLYNAGRIRCRIVLKNIAAGSLAQVLELHQKDSRFIAPFHIYEADELWRSNRKKFKQVHSTLNSLLTQLKGQGAITYMSKNTNAYESRNFTEGSFIACPSGRESANRRP